ncbi:MAG: D-alanyl-D-alanine carboxypeptidase family protein [Clostridiaceae bacterium]|nr:D-alanyl-D-alanine carboxypeptidase family protein [Clostridiaceae bacterium]
MRKSVCLLLCLCMLLPFLPVRSAALFDVASPSAVLIAPDGRVLFEKDAHKQMEPASVTKVMTLLLVFEALDRGDIKLTDMVTASAHACSMGGTQIWLEEGEQLSVEDMIKCVVLPSANDCSVALAEYLGGTEEAFVEKMNARAAELGMNDTHFVNACGLHVEGHVTSAYDIAMMSRELMRHEQIKNYTLLWQDSVRNGEFVLTNTNKLIKSYRGITGLKTGFTSQAGYCVSATAERDGLALVAVIMKGATIESRNADAAALLDYGFANFAAYTPTSDQPMAVNVKLGKTKQIACRLQTGDPLVVEKEVLKNLDKTLSLPVEVPAPVAEGQVLGTLTITKDGAPIAEIPVLAAESSERLTTWNLFVYLLRSLALRKN